LALKATPPKQVAAASAASLPLQFSMRRSLRTLEAASSAPALSAPMVLAPIKDAGVPGASVRTASPAGVAGRLRPQQRRDVMAFRMDDSDEEEAAGQGGSPAMRRQPSSCSLVGLYEALGTEIHVLADSEERPGTGAQPRATPLRGTAVKRSTSLSALSTAASSPAASPSMSTQVRGRSKVQLGAELSPLLSKAGLPPCRSPTSTPSWGLPSSQVCDPLAASLLDRRSPGARRPGALRRSCSATRF